MVGGVNVVHRTTRLSDDTGIGLLFVGMLALGVIIISREDTYAGDLTSFLFGDILGVDAADLRLAAIVLVVTIAGDVRRPPVVPRPRRRRRTRRPRSGCARASPTPRCWRCWRCRSSPASAPSARCSCSGCSSPRRRRPSCSSAGCPLAMATAVGFGWLAVVVGLVVSYHADTAASASIAGIAVGQFLSCWVTEAGKRRRVCRRPPVTDGTDASSSITVAPVERAPKASPRRTVLASHICSNERHGRAEMDVGREALDVMVGDLHHWCAAPAEAGPRTGGHHLGDTGRGNPGAVKRQRERWSWLVVTDDAVKRPIAELYLAAWNELHCGIRLRLRRMASRAIGAADPLEQRLVEARRDPNYRAGEHLAANIGSVPVWIFAVVNGVKGTPTVVDGADIFGAVQNLMLAARAHGLGTTLTMLHRRHEAEVASVLKLPTDARALALVPMGYPMSGRFRETRRQPVDAVTYWNEWGGRRTRVASAVR